MTPSIAEIDLLVAMVSLGTTPDVSVLTVQFASLVGTHGESVHLLTAAAFVSMVLAHIPPGVCELEPV